MTTVAWWALVAFGALTIGELANAYYQAGQIDRMAEAHNAIVAELSSIRRTAQAQARRIAQLEDRAAGVGDTGPIAVGRTPVPSTVTGIPSARPQVPAGATAVGAPGRGAHRRAKQ